MPSNKELMLISKDEDQMLQKANNYKQQVAAQTMMSSTFHSNMSFLEQPAGSRMPKPFKKT